MAAKRSIVLESQTGLGAIGGTARRHGISRSQLMAWRRAFQTDPEVGSSGFMPVTVEPVAEAVVPMVRVAPNRSAPASGEATTTMPNMAASAISPVPPAFGRVEIVLTSGRRLVLDGAMDTDAVLGLARGLERLS